MSTGPNRGATDEWITALCRENRTALMHLLEHHDGDIQALALDLLARAQKANSNGGVSGMRRPIHHWSGYIDVRLQDGASLGYRGRCSGCEWLGSERFSDVRAWRDLVQHAAESHPFDQEPRTVYGDG